MYITKSDNGLFPEESVAKEVPKTHETRKVYLNNEWQDTDTLGHTDYEGITGENPNIDSENMNFKDNSQCNIDSMKPLQIIISHNI